MSHPNGPRTGRPPMYATGAMVATSHTLATLSGVRVLRQGGSAVDAAIAANAVLCVAYPHMAGLGGDGFWLIGRRGSDRVEALNASGPAAELADLSYYEDRDVRDSIPSRGPLAAVTVPGAVDGWREVHERHGRTEWSDLFTDAIRYAAEGIPVSRSLEAWSAQDVDDLSEYPATAEIFLPGGRAPRMGELLHQPALAGSFRSIASDGARGAFYDGPIAERICESLAQQGSPLRAEDFARFRAEWVEPISASYRDHTVFEFPPNTQGFAALQILGMLDGYDVASWGDGSVEYYHHLAEIVKLSFADRNEWLTDPKFVDIPLDRLLDPAYLAERRGPDRPRPGDDHGGGRAGHRLPRRRRPQVAGGRHLRVLRGRRRRPGRVGDPVDLPRLRQHGRGR
jgi:oxamate amidohydrolase